MSNLYKKIGDFIEIVDRRNKELKVSNLLGININKEFMPSVANKSGLDLSKYKVIKKGEFAYSSMQVGRDKTIRIALYQDENPAVISPAYLVIKIKDEDKLLPEYLMLNFLRDEMDRYGWFISDSSVRASLEWDRLCDIKIPIPDIKVQKKYVSIYKALQKNQSIYEKSLKDLEFVTQGYIEKLKNNTSKKKIGDFVRLVDKRNRDKKVKNLIGLNVDKEFMPSKAKVSQSSLANYKILEKNQFLYSPMQVGRDETVRVALYLKEDIAIVSPAYYVFEVKDTSIVLSEYLMMWFYRDEFNRLGWFYSDSSVRASLDWERFCEIEIPIPSIEKQKAIVTIYNVLQKRKKINEQLKQKLTSIAPVLIRGVVEEFEKVRYDY